MVIAERVFFMETKVSIVVRTHNEERWLSHCLDAIFRQDFTNYEVIIVDNNSTDSSLDIVRKYNVRIFTINDYLPGRALNLGTKHARGQYICYLSGHCIPINHHWLSNLVQNFDMDNIAGAYGRQEPMAFSSDFDKRDLLNLFGLDKKIQIRDSFLNNDKSIIRKDVWEEVPFDEKATNIEDRIWAQEVLKKGYKIVYEPEASVLHYHGIHQNNDTKRCYNVARILESLDLQTYNREKVFEKPHVVALIPIKGEVHYLGKRPLLQYTVERCKQSRFVDQVVVSTDNPELASIAKDLGADAPFIRPKELSADYIDLERILKFSLEEMEKKNIIPDILVVLEPTYPFRPKYLIDAMIQRYIQKGADTVLAVKEEFKACWIKKAEEFDRVDAGFMPRSFKNPLYIGLFGLGCVVNPKVIKEGNRLGNRIDFVEVDDLFSSLEVRTKTDLAYVEKIMSVWWGPEC